MNFGIVVEKPLELQAWIEVDLVNSRPCLKLDNTYQQISQSTNEACIEMDLLQVGSEPVGMRCPHCHEEIMTRADYKNSSKTHLAAVLLSFLFWWLCCCILPYFLKRWKNVEHYCPNCRRFLGVYTRNKLF